MNGQGVEEGGVKVYVLFYAREDEKPVGGVLGYFQNQLNFWHCEIAFPLSFFEPHTIPQPPAGVNRESLIWAFGIFNTNKEFYPRAEILYENGKSIIVDPDISAPPDAGGKRRVIQIDSSRLIKSTETLSELDSSGAPISAQYQVFQCKKKRFFGKDTLITWPDGTQNVGDAEVRLRKGDGMIQLCTPGTGFGKLRSFSNPKYRQQVFYVPWADAARAVRYCSAQVGKQYDHNGIRRSLFWPSKHSIHSDRLYCVNMVITALQQAGIARGRAPNGLTTDELYDILKTHPGVKVSTILPHRQQQFIQNVKETNAKRFDNRGMRNKARESKDRRKPRIKGSTLKKKTFAQLEREMMEMT